MNGLVTGRRIHFDDRHLHVELDDGRIISTPMAWYKELQDASWSDLLEYRFICQGTGIEWPKIDYHLSIESMLVTQASQQAA